MLESITTKEFCQNWLAAWTGNRPKQLIAFYSNDIYYQDPARPLGVKGKDHLFKYFTKLLAKYPHWLWQLVEIFPFDSGFTLKWQAKLYNTATAKLFYGLDLVELTNGKISRNEVYFDPGVLKI